MDEESFWADVEVEPVGDGLFHAVLAIGRGGDEDQVIRVPLAGEHLTPEDAIAAARLAITAMTLPPSG